MAHATPFTWPSTLLSSSNRALVAEAEELTAKLNAKRQACEECSDAVAQMKVSAAQARRMISAVGKELADGRLSAEKQTSEAKIMKGECERMSREVQLREAEAERLRLLSRECESALTAAQRNLETSISMAAYLEDTAKEVLSYRLACEATSDALGTEVTGLSSTVLAKLRSLNEAVTRQQLELNGARDEHQHVLRELDAVRAALRAAVQDQRSSVQELALVHAESVAADRAILKNSEAMQAMKEQEAARANRRARLAATLAALQMDVKVARKACEAKRGTYDKTLARMREALESLREQATLMAAVQRQRRAEGQHGHSLLDTLSDQEVLSGERRASVAQQRQYAAQLQELLRTLAKESLTNPTPSPESLHTTYITLQQQLARCEDRLERAQRRVTEAVQGMIVEGRRGESIQESLSRTEQALSLIRADQTAKAEVLQKAAASAKLLSEELAERQALLPELQAVSLAQADQRRREHEATIGRLRDRLVEAMGGYRHLLHANTSLRVSLRRAHEELQQQQSAFHQHAEDGVLLGGEVPRRERELAELEERARTLAMEHGQAQATLESLRAAAEGQASAMREGAGVEDRLRAQTAGQLAHLEADMQAALVELHLLQAAAREHGEELRRHARRRDLLRSRYEELMRSLSRAARTPLGAKVEGGEASSRGAPPVPMPLAPSLGELADDAAPEALHARLLLQRSYERERLMEKGNYLDLRLVSLERETSTLRNMLEALRKEGGHTALPDRASAGYAPVTPSGPRALAHVNPNAVPAPLAGLTQAGKVDDGGAASGERSQLMQTELSLQEAALAAMHTQCELSRSQLKTMRKALHELQAAEKQKRLHLQRMKDQLHRERQRVIHHDYKQLQKGRGFLRK